MRHFLSSKISLSLFFIAPLFLFSPVNYAHSSHGGVNFHGKVVEDSATARNKCRRDAIESGISQRCSAHRGTNVRTTVTDSTMSAGTQPDSGNVKIRRIIMNYD